MSTHATETVYRQVIVPAAPGWAIVMDAIFGDDRAAAGNGDGRTPECLIPDCP
jgi:hypothetical protein